MKKKYAGYIHLKPLNGVIYPSSIQNILMKNFVEENLKGIFYLSPTELLQSKYAITLNTLLSKDTKVTVLLCYQVLCFQKVLLREKICILNYLVQKKLFLF